jgi:enterochelin esterase-like enzyme
MSARDEKDRFLLVAAHGKSPLRCRLRRCRLLFRQALAALSFLLMLAASPFSTALLAGEIVRHSMYSEVLGRNYSFLVYLPAGWRTLDNLPIIYLLHGAGGDHASWVNDGQIESIASSLIDSNQIPPSVIVMPGMVDCWWVNSKSCRYEDFFWQEFDPYIASTFPVSANRNDRLIGGVSAGGFGAIRFALTHPSSFVAAIALSAAIYTDRPPAFSQLRVRSPFLGSNGEFDAPSWNRVNYPSLLTSYAAQNDRISFYLASGNHDPYGLTNEATKFNASIMRVLGQTCELHISTGRHDWIYWRGVIGPALKAAFSSRNK